LSCAGELILVEWFGAGALAQALLGGKISFTSLFPKGKKYSKLKNDLAFGV
jgi:hypothetical protein